MDDGVVLGEKTSTPTVADRIDEIGGRRTQDVCHRFDCKTESFGIGRFSGRNYLGMIAIICSTLVASILGSGHCVGMCGPFAMIASHRTTGPDGDQGVKGKSWVLPVAYNLGRLATYLVFGLVAGILGIAVNFSGQQFGLQQAAIYFAGGTLILFGIVGIARNLGVSFLQFGVSQKMIGWLQQGIRSSNKSLPVYRAFSIGMLTSLMPCGWLYFFVIAASSTQSLLFAPVVMFAFWLGTLPVLLSLGLSSSFLMKALRSRANWIIPVLMLMIGIYSVTSRSPIELANRFANEDVNTVTQTLSTADSSESACCSDENS